MPLLLHECDNCLSSEGNLVFVGYAARSEVSIMQDYDPFRSQGIWSKREVIVLLQEGRSATTSHGAFRLAFRALAETAKPPQVSIGVRLENEHSTWWWATPMCMS
jgi:hypothetical protein